MSKKTIKTNNNINYDSTKAIYDLLKKAALEPIHFVDNQEFIDALKSQGGIAKISGEWSFDGDTIKKTDVSLNTLKKYAGLLFNRGFDEINELRIKASDAIENELSKESKPNKKTRKGLEVMLSECEKALTKHKETNMILLTALSSALQNMNSISSADDKKLRKQRAEYAIERLRAIVSLNQPPFDNIDSDNNIISLTEYTGEKKQ